MFRDNFLTICRAHHLALKTERVYWSAASHYIKWLGAKSAKDLEQDPTGNFRKFLSSMANQNPDRGEGDEGVSASTQNLHWHAVRFLLEKVVGITLGDLSGIPRATAHTRIVQVPETDEAARIVNSISGKVGTALRTIFATAGRLNDILRLRLKDLDFKKDLIAIQESKGGKSRLVPMPKNLKLELLKLSLDREKIHQDDLKAGLGSVHMPGLLAKKYPEAEKSLEWQYLFCSDSISKDPVTGRFGRTHLQDVTLQRAFSLARKRLKIRTRYTIHSLRHCTAQFWERNNVPRSTIQTLMGHRFSTTTDGYLQSGKRNVSTIPTPI